MRKCVRLKIDGETKDKSNKPVHRKEDEMLVEIAEKEQKRRLSTIQTGGPFQKKGKQIIVPKHMGGGTNQRTIRISKRHRKSFNLMQDTPSKWTVK